MDTICKTADLAKPGIKAQAREDPEPVVVCAFCRHLITEPSLQIQVNGSFYHVFANPHGIVYEIGCFSGAPGCRTSSLPSEVFSWFSGFSWQICICSGCGCHLGWRFVSDSDLFYGLILDKLIFP